MIARISAAGLLAFALIAGARTSHGQEPAADAEAPAAATKPDAPAPPKAKAASVRVGELRRGMEQDLAEIGKIGQKVRRDGDMVKIACVTDKEDRAEGVMDVATPEIALLQDGSADSASQSFAGQKLKAAAQNLGKLLDEARACTGAPAATRGATDNVVDEGERLPPEDPTAAPGSGPGLPPTIDPGRPPVASPVR